FGRVNGEDRIIFKQPKTDSGEKNSAHGLVKVIKGPNGYELVERCATIGEPDDEMRPVFLDGTLLIEQSLSDIRRRLSESVAEVPV
ncbi:MAG: putative nicotinate phosphoribosyltransferase, partial [Bryobacterales bacterium]|nr:putative nicotinate phosphoribosyltransferase [Bryobacterales bacterium]